ncbi:MAG: WS/DGAT/MGAT family O-acyltransferase [Solirubrobacterales bacterium]
MAQAHMDRLSSTDASFLTQETSHSHMHVGAVLIFEGPPPGYEDLLEHVQSRLHLVPRFRQKLAFSPFETGRPFWVDDPNFNLGYHVRHSALPSPGSREQLRNMVARVFSQQLDRTKPLWELWLVQGMKRKRFAIVTKTHHALVDGVSGVDIATVLFDVKPVPEPIKPETEWVAEPEPSGAQLLARNLEDLATTPIRLARGLERALEDPGTTVKHAAEAVEGVGEIAWNLANPAPDVPLNVPIGSHRRFAWVRADLDDLKAIKNRLGGTVNDVVLSVVTGALRGWLRARGIRTEGLELRGLVPVSVRSPDEHGELGNRLAALRGPLPVYVEDPVKRLDAVKVEMGGVKESKQALGAEAIVRFNDFAPPTLLVQSSRLNFSTRLFNLIVTNVPGPQIPLYVLGRELENVFPVAFLPQNHALAIAIMSYNGHMDFGLLADYDSMGDVELIGDGIEHAIAELRQAADSERPAEEPAAAKATT